MPILLVETASWLILSGPFAESIMRIAGFTVLFFGLVASASAQSTGVPYGTALDPSPELAPGDGPMLFSRDRSSGEVNPPEYFRRCTPEQAWFSADYLVWFLRKERTPSLIETFPDDQATSSNVTGVRTLFPDRSRLDFKGFNGARINAGYWFSTAPKVGIDGSFFFLEQNSIGASFDSTGSPVLARFYTEANQGARTSLMFANPTSDGYGGSLASVATVSSLYSADVNLRVNGYTVFADNTDWQFGVRYFDYRERLDISGTARFRDTSSGVASLVVADHFAVSNQFYGGQVGFNSTWCGFAGFSLDANVKASLGGMCQRVVINGYNSFIGTDGSVDREERGLYAQPSNSGVHTRTKTVFMPEMTLNLNYQLSEVGSIFFGYNLLWVSNVIRPGRVIDDRVNDSTLRYIANPTSGNAAGPTFSFRGEDIWLQGINVGLRFQY